MPSRLLRTTSSFSYHKKTFLSIRTVIIQHFLLCSLHLLVHVAWLGMQMTMMNQWICKLANDLIWQLGHLLLRGSCSLLSNSPSLNITALELNIIFPYLTTWVNTSVVASPLVQERVEKTAWTQERYPYCMFTSPHWRTSVSDGDEQSDIWVTSSVTSAPFPAKSRSFKRSQQFRLQIFTDELNPVSCDLQREWSSTQRALQLGKLSREGKLPVRPRSAWLSAKWEKIA